MASWFYLTLWRGTPPEFTSEAEVEIHENSYAGAFIARSTETQAEIKTTDSHAVQVVESEQAVCDVITTTEVVWLVGRTVH